MGREGESPMGRWGDEAMGRAREEASLARSQSGRSAPLTGQMARLAGAMVVAALAFWLFAADGVEMLGTALGGKTESGAPAVGGRAPAFSLPSADGQTISLESFHGRPVIINFWATWCVPCRTEMPALEAAYQTYRERGLVVLAVNMGEDREDVVPFGRELGLTFPLLLDPLGRIAAEYGVKGLPTTFFVDRDGRITRIHAGALSERALEEQLQRVL